MPRSRLACALVLAGCGFRADYGDGDYTCSDGRCPSGLMCNPAHQCVVPNDAGDAPIDMPPAALTCADPGIIPIGGGTANGTTAGRPSVLAPACGGFVMNGREAVHRITVAAGDRVVVALTGLRKAYVITPCLTATTACINNTFATDGNPISVTAVAAGDLFIVVDDENPANAGPFGLTLTVN